jgi:hypothetical protein
MAIRKGANENLKGVQFAHEFGHNCGLGDRRDDGKWVMYYAANTGSRSIGEGGL